MTLESELFLSLEKAIQEHLDKQDKFLLEGLSHVDELFTRFYGNLEIGELKSRFSQGDSMALLAAIGKCLTADIQTPDWVRCGFLRAFCSYRAGVVRTLDEAFHVERPPSWPRKRALKNMLDFDLWQRVEEYRSKNPHKVSSDRELFEIVADEFNLEFVENFREFESKFKIKVNWRDVENGFKRTQDDLAQNPQF
jgi:hypothetical protein